MTDDRKDTGSRNEADALQDRAAQRQQDERARGESSAGGGGTTGLPTDEEVGNESTGARDGGVQSGG